MVMTPLDCAAIAPRTTAQNAARFKSMCRMPVASDMAQLPVRAVHQPERVAGFVQRLFRSALQKNLAVGRQPVELLPQPRQRNHRHPAAQLRVPENKRQHRDEQVPLRYRQQLQRVRRAAPAAAFRAPGSSRTGRGPRRKRNPRRASSTSRTGTPNSPPPAREPP